MNMPENTSGRLWIDLDGDFWGSEALSLAERLPLSELASAKLVVLSLGKVRCIDEAGLAMLVRLYSHLRVRGSRLQLVDAPVAVQELLERVGFTRLVSCENGAVGELAHHTITLGTRVET